MNCKQTFSRLVLCGILFATLTHSLSNKGLYTQPIESNNWLVTCIQKLLQQIRTLFENFCPKTTQSYITTSTISSSTSSISYSVLFAIADNVGVIKIYSESYVPIINFTAHDEGIERLLSIPGKKILASCSDDSSVKLWNTTDWSLIRSYKRHTDQIWAMEYLEPDIMVSASFDLTTQFWRISTGETIMKINNEQPITCLRRLSKNLLAGGDFENDIYIWDLDNSTRLISKLKGQGLLVDDIVLINEKVIATANDDFTISFWDLATDSIITTFKAHSSNVNALKLLSPNLIVSASADRSIKVWSFLSLTNVTLINSLISHQAGIVYALDIFTSKTGKYLISGSLDETVKIWSVNVNNEISLVQTVTTELDITALVVI